MTAPTSKVILRPADFTHQTLTVGDLKMHVVMDGPEDGPLAVLLHGFPEFWYSWRHQIKPLAEAGYRVVVPDQRGYNLTDKHGPYDVFTLTADVAGLIRTLGHEKAIIVGHDWGGVVAWCFAAFYPQMTRQLVVCNAPHVGAYMDVMRSFYMPQIMKSWYVAFFQIPVLPELVLSTRNFEALSRTLAKESPMLTPEELGYFREAWGQPGALSASIRWYRTIAQQIQRVIIRDLRVSMPTRLIWGEPDLALERRVAEAARQYCDDLDIQYVPNSGHFVQQEAPGEVNRLMLEFLASASE